MDQLYSKKGGKRVLFFNSQKVFVHNRVPSKQLYLIEDLSNSWGTKLKNCRGVVFNKGLRRILIIWKTLHFRVLTEIWFSKVNGPALLKERLRKGFVFFRSQKVFVHNSTIGYHPTNCIIEDLSHSWGTTLKNCLGAVFK